MTDTMREEKIQLLQKLQNLASCDPESEEAKTAAKMAAEIMERYGLSTVDLDADGNLNTDDISEFWERSYDNSMLKWESILLGGVSSAFNCRCIRLLNPAGSKDTATLSIIGAKTDVELASWFFSSLHRRIGKMSEKHSRSKDRNRDFGIGVATSVSQRLYEMKKEQERIRTEETTALVISKKDSVDKEYDSRYPDAKVDGRRNNNPTDRVSFLAGVLAGKDMSLSTPVEQGGDAPLRLE